MFSRKKYFTKTDANELCKKYEVKLEKNYNKLVRCIERKIKYEAKHGEKTTMYRISHQEEYPTGFQARLEEYFSERQFTTYYDESLYEICIIISWK